MRSAYTMEAQKAELEAKEQLLGEQADASEKEKWEIGRQLLEEQLTTTQISNVSAATWYERLYEQRLEYKQQSVLMQIDPQQVQRGDITFLIQTDIMEQTYNVEKVYEELLTSTEMFEYVKEQCGIEQGVGELITVGTAVGATSDRMLSEDINSQRVQIVHSDADICRNMMDAVISYVETKEAELQSVIGKHVITVVAQSQGVVMDQELFEKQKAVDTDMNTFQSNYAKLQQDFTDVEKQYYAYLMSEPDAQSVETEGTDVTTETEAEVIEAEETTVTQSIAGPTISIKYIMLGVVLFAFMYMFYLFLVYIMNNKLRIADNLQELYGIPQFVTVTAPRKNRLLGFVDQWILKLRYHNSRQFTTEEAITLASTAVKMATKKHALEEVYLLGCNVTGDTLQKCNQISKNLQAGGIRVQILSNVLYDAEAMEKLENAKGAVLVETVGSTMYEEVVKELQLMDRQKICVLGGIVVE